MLVCNRKLILIYTKIKDECMKRFGNLFEQVCSMDNLRLAHKNARKGKTLYKILYNKYIVWR